MILQTIVTLLFITSIVISFSGCAAQQPQEPKIVYIPQKCVIQAVDEPVMDNKRYINSKDIVAKSILNYEAMKEYAEKLLASQEVCK
jgi:hypothetical protein